LPARANASNFEGFCTLVSLLTELFSELTLIFIILSALRAYLPDHFQSAAADAIIIKTYNGPDKNPERVM
jgi:hypothetical protein